MRSRYKITDKDGIYFITSTIVEWLPIFTSSAYFDIIINSFDFCRKSKALKLYAYTILDNHFHVICSAPELSETIQSLKSFTAKQIVRQLQKDNKKWALRILEYQKKHYKDQSTYQVWQEGFHLVLIHDEKMLIQKIEYTHFNIVKRCLVWQPEQWRYSSAGFFCGEADSVLQIDPLPI